MDQMTRVTVTTHQIEVATWHWLCPVCEKEMQSQTHPRSKEDQRCEACYTVDREAYFQSHFSDFVGSTVLGVKQATDPIDEEDVSSIRLLDTNGQAWRVTSDTALYVYKNPPPTGRD